MTNRQWLESLSDFQLAAFLTTGIPVRMINFHTQSFPIDVWTIAHQYTDSVLGINTWLNEPQEYCLYEEDNRNGCND